MAHWEVEADYAKDPLHAEDSGNAVRSHRPGEAEVCGSMHSSCDSTSGSQRVCTGSLEVALEGDEEDGSPSAEAETRPSSPFHSVQAPSH